MLVGTDNFQSKSSTDNYKDTMVESKWETERKLD